MKLFDKLERKFGRFAIPNLMYYVIGIYIIGFIVQMFAPMVYTYLFSLNMEMVFKGQIWRLFTFLFQPPSTSIIFIIFTLYFYWMIGSALENLWGAFKFNLYYFSGVIFHIIAALLVYLIFGKSFDTMTTYYINLALFMAFAVEHGETQVSLFFIIPIKIKWLAWLDGIVFAITIVGGFLVPFMPKFIWAGLYNMGLLAGNYYYCLINAICALVSMLNFIIFMVFVKGKRRFNTTQTQKNYRKAMKTAKKAAERNANPYGGYNTFEGNATSDKNGHYSGKSGQAKHRCAVCKRTELDAPDLVFRFCSKCEGNYEYCNEHLYTHVHVTANNKSVNSDGNVVDFNGYKR